MPQTEIQFASQVTNTFATEISKVSNDDNNFAIADTVGQLGTIQLTDLTADIGIINYIKVVIQAFTTPGKRVARVALYLENQSGTALQTEFVDVASPVETSFETGLITTDGTSAWTETSVNDLRLTIRYYQDINGGGSTDLLIDYVKVLVNYVIPFVPTPTYDSSANNIHCTLGNINVKSGNVFL